MTDSSDLLERLGVNKIGELFGTLWGRIMMFLGMLVGAINRGIARALKFTSMGKRVGPILDVGLGLAVMLFLYITEAVNIEQGDNYFAINLLTARVVFFLSGGFIFLLGAAQLSALIGEVVPGVPEIELFSDSYKEYTSSLKHGLHALLLITLTLMWNVSDNDKNIVWKDSSSNSGVATFFLIILVVTLLSRWFSELEHGAVSREEVELGDAKLSLRLKDEYSFKHARGPAVLISLALTLYMRVHSDTDDVASWITDATTALLLVIYMVVVILERFQKANTELVIGEEAGFVVTGVITTLMLIFAGVDVAQKRTQESVFVALGVIMLDSMRVGYAMKSPRESNAIDEREAVWYRLLQILVGGITFMYVTKTSSDQHAATTPLLFGVALAAALTKIQGISYISKKMFIGGSEHFFRTLASTGILLTSAYLWSHPLDASKSQTGAVLFFCLGIAARFLDSILDFRVGGGRSVAEYLSWDMQKDLIDSPTNDNPRTWLVFISILASLIFAGLAMNTAWDRVKVERANADDDELGKGLITAVFFLALHLLVVIVAIVEGFTNNELVGWGALSRSRFVRTAVSTTVLSALAVAAGGFGFDKAEGLGSDGAESQVLTSLVAYVFADTIGRELL